MHSIAHYLATVNLGRSVPSWAAAALFGIKVSVLLCQDEDFAAYEEEQQRAAAAAEAEAIRRQVCKLRPADQQSILVTCLACCTAVNSGKGNLHCFIQVWLTPRSGIPLQADEEAARQAAAVARHTAIRDQRLRDIEEDRRRAAAALAGAICT